MTGSKRRNAGDREELERRALLAARTLVDRMRSLYRDLERDTGAPIAAHRALACVGDEPGITASRLALALGMQRPALSHVLRSLVEGGWVERVRSDADQRSVRLYLAVPGRRVLAATAGRAVGTLQRAVRQLTDRGLEGLAASLDEVLQHLPAVDGNQATVPAARSSATARRRRLRAK